MGEFVCVGRGPLSLRQGSGMVQECEEPQPLGLRVLEHGRRGKGGGMGVCATTGVCACVWECAWVEMHSFACVHTCADVTATGLGIRGWAGSSEQTV